MARAATRRRLLAALLLGLAGWGAFSAWQVWAARRAGRALADCLLPDGTVAPPEADLETMLRAAALGLRDGDFRAAAKALAPPGELSDEQQRAAQRFLAANAELRQRFLAATSDARRRAADGDDVARTRHTLAMALAAAAEGDQDRCGLFLQAAERSLDGSSASGAAGVAGPQAVLAAAADLEPALRLGRELLTEGHEAAEQLAARASRCYQQQQYADAAVMLELASELLGAPRTASAGEGQAGEWFAAMAAAPLPPAAADEAERSVGLCEAVAQSQSPSPPVRRIVQRARRELQSGRCDEARWWAGVALQAMGLSPSGHGGQSP